MRWFGVPFLMLWTQVAVSYPENVRFGYSSCVSCHVNPNGGGVLRPYGKHAAKDFLNTWSDSIEETIPEEAPPVLFGADLRGLSLTQQMAKERRSRTFLMQAEAEIAIPWESLTVVGAYGQYDELRYSPRYYLLWQPTEQLLIQAGRFFPAYGLMSSGHMLLIRRGLGFDQGQESNNVALGYLSESGEITVTSLRQTGEHGTRSGEKGFATRAVWYAGEHSQLGVSALSTTEASTKRSAWGVHVNTSLYQTLYWLGEFDLERRQLASGDEQIQQQLLTYDKVGWEFVQGCHLQWSHESSIPTQGKRFSKTWGTGPSFQWFPVSHIELLAQAQQVFNERLPTPTSYVYALMVHSYW